MRFRTALTTAGILLASTALSFAGPTATIDNVTIPIGAVAGGNSMISGIVESNVITAPGQQLQAIGEVTSINDPASNFTWLTGQNGVVLVYTITGYTATSITAPTLTTGGTVLFNNGLASSTLNFYVLSASGFTLTGAGSVAADIAHIQTGTLWLSEKGAPVDAGGDTLIASLPIGSTLTNFANATVAGMTDVGTGGDADAYFSTRTFANVFDPDGFSDSANSATFNTGVVADGFEGSGTASLKVNTQAVPEPGMVGLFGLGFVYLTRLRKR